MIGLTAVQMVSFTKSGTANIILFFIVYLGVLWSFYFVFLFWNSSTLSVFPGALYDSLSQVINLICHSLLMCLWIITKEIL